MSHVSPFIVVHGGASSIPASQRKVCEDGVKKAVLKGYQVLMEGGSAVDAVKAAVMLMEDNPYFNAGYGSVPNIEGFVENDALIMDGSTLDVGAVATVRRVRNAVALAHEVMKKTPHCFLSGEGAEKFARSINFPLLDSDTDLLTTKSLERAYSGNGSYHNVVQNLFNTDKTPLPLDITCSHDTVGAVAVDCNGRAACATSTGGISGKMVGRIGDCPLVGGGGYANEAGASSATGHGEAMMKTCVCRMAVLYMEQGCTATEAAQKAVDYTFQRTGSRCGVICINNRGEPGFAFSTPMMSWATAGSGSLKYSTTLQDVIIEDLEASWNLPAV